MRIVRHHLLKNYKCYNRADIDTKKRLAFIVAIDGEL